MQGISNQCRAATSARTECARQLERDTRTLHEPRSAMARRTDLSPAVEGDVRDAPMSEMPSAGVMTSSAEVLLLPRPALRDGLAASWLPDAMLLEFLVTCQPTFFLDRRPQTIIARSRHGASSHLLQTTPNIYGICSASWPYASPTPSPCKYDLGVWEMGRAQ